MTTDLKLAVAYARVSTKEQERTGHTLPVQSKNMEEYAKNKGLKIVKEFVVAESASKRDRKYYQEMWKFLGQHKEIKHIIFEEIDRFTRNDKDKVDLVDKINQEGYIAHFVLEKLILDKETSPNDIFLFDILVAKAKNYSAALSQKVKKGQLGKLEKGGYPGGYPPFGYKKVKGDLFPEEPYASCVKKAFEIYAQQHVSLRRLAQMLNEMGFRTRADKKITKKFIHAVLNNPIYTGIILWNKNTFRGYHQPLIDKNCFNQVQKWLNRKNCAYWTRHNFTYRGLLRCGECGCTITGETHKGFVYYHCSFYRGCSQHKYTREETIEEQVLEVLKSLSLGERVAGIVKEKIIAKKEEEEGFKRMRIEDLKQQYQRMIDWIDRLYDDKMAGLIDEEMYRRKSQDYLRRKEEIATTLESYNNGELNTFELSLDVLDLANRAAEIYKRRTPEEKRLLLKILLLNASLKDKKVDFTLRNPFNYIVEYKKSENWSERRDSNPRPHGPKPCALNQLRHSPVPRAGLEPAR
jgi:site-specific DNA recombinase